VVVVVVVVYVVNLVFVFSWQVPHFSTRRRKSEQRR
jgi:hypothetical protein